MKILLVNSYLYLRGGDCRYTFGLNKLLQKRGLNTFLWGMEHKLNIENISTDFLVSNIDFTDSINKLNINNIINVINRVLWSKESKIKFEKVINYFKPDVVHLNNIHHHISPSILEVTDKYKIPVVWTLHDYKLICPNTHLFDENSESICERCKNSKFYFPIIKKCKKKSFAASFVAAIEAYYHTYKRILDFINYFICPSNFLANKLLENGFNKKKLSVIPNFIESDWLNFANYYDDYILFVGRISKIKGIEYLLTAMQKLKGIKLLIAGDGDLNILNRINKTSNNYITYLGKVYGDELKKLYANSKFIIVPSIWFENFPYTVLESFATGKPVLGSKLGGIVEMIGEKEERGYFFNPFEEESIISVIKKALNDEEYYIKKSQNAFEFAKNICNEDIYFDNIFNIYKSLA